MTGNPCMARLHLACRCCRPIGHDGPHNCLHPDGGVVGSDTTARRPLDLDAIRARNANGVNRRDLLALIEEVELVRAELLACTTRVADALEWLNDANAAGAFPSYPQYAALHDIVARIIPENGDTSWIH